jgi:hypothetical protein
MVRALQPNLDNFVSAPLAPREVLANRSRKPGCRRAILGVLTIRILVTEETSLGHVERVTRRCTTEQIRRRERARGRPFAARPAVCAALARSIDGV